jgi:hypothetical protein
MQVLSILQLYSNSLIIGLEPQFLFGTDCNDHRRIISSDRSMNLEKPNNAPPVMLRHFSIIEDQNLFLIYAAYL